MLDSFDEALLPIGAFSASAAFLVVPRLFFAEHLFDSGQQSNNPVGANRRPAFQFSFWHRVTWLVFRAVAHPER